MEHFRSPIVHFLSTPRIKVNNRCPLALWLLGPFPSPTQLPSLHFFLEGTFLSLPSAGMHQKLVPNQFECTNLTCAWSVKPKDRHSSAWMSTTGSCGFGCSFAFKLERITWNRIHLRQLDALITFSYDLSRSIGSQGRNLLLSSLRGDFEVKFRGDFEVKFQMARSNFLNSQQFFFNLKPYGHSESVSELSALNE
jgi:hypothetical protein